MPQRRPKTQSLHTFGLDGLVGKPWVSAPVLRHIGFDISTQC